MGDAACDGSFWAKAVATIRSAIPAAAAIRLCQGRRTLSHKHLVVVMLFPSAASSVSCVVDRILLDRPSGRGHCYRVSPKSLKGATKYCLSGSVRRQRSARTFLAHAGKARHLTTAPLTELSRRDWESRAGRSEERRVGKEWRSRWS